MTHRTNGDGPAGSGPGFVAGIADRSVDLLFRYELRDPIGFSYVSPSSTSMTGYSPAEHVADPFLGRRIVHPDDAHLLDPDGPPHRVIRWLHRDGHLLWTEQHLHVVVDARGAVAVEGTARDVTLRELRTGVEEAVERFRSSLLGSLLEPADRAGPRWDRLATDLVAVTGGRSVRIVDPADPPWAPPRGTGARPDAGARRDTVVVVGPTGRLAVVAELGRDAPLSQHVLAAIQRVLGALELADVADGALGRASQLAQALGRTGLSVLVTDRGGRIVWVNEAFTELHGWAVEDVVGRTPRVISSGLQDPSFYARLWATIVAGGRFSARLVNRRRDGSLYDAQVTIDPFRYADGTIRGFVGVQRDLTDELEAQARLHAREMAALQHEHEVTLDRALLVQTLSHELRTPVTVLVGAADALARTGVGEMDRTRLQEAARRASRDIEHKLELLTSAAPNRWTVERSEVRAVLDRVVDGLDPAWRARLSVSGTATWVGARPLLRAAVRPLVENALSHTDGEVRVAIGADLDGTLRVAVHDDGPGITDTLLALLDRPFVQRDRSTTRATGGLGLGIFAARRASELLGGRLVLANRPAGGLTATVVVPGADEPRPT